MDDGFLPFGDLLRHVFLFTQVKIVRLWRISCEGKNGQNIWASFSQDEDGCIFTNGICKYVPAVFLRDGLRRSINVCILAGMGQC